MKAVVKKVAGPGLGFGVEHPEPQRRQGEALLRPLVAAICGTDLHIEAWEGPYQDLEAHLPFVLGHEFVAEVVEGDAFVPGQRVVAVSINGCGGCPTCLSRQPQLCEEARSDSLGMSRNGALAELMTLPEGRLFPVSEQVTNEVAAMCEPFATSYRAAMTAGSRLKGSRVLVLGPGVIGLMVALVASLEEPERLVVAGLERDRPRLDLAESLGLNVAVLPDDTQADDIRQVLGSKPEVIYEATGSPRAAATGLHSLATQGMLVAVGIHDRPVPVDSGVMVRRELSMVGSYAAGLADWERSLELLERGLIDLRPLAGPVYSLSESEAAFRATENGVVGRALIRCNG